MVKERKNPSNFIVLNKTIPSRIMSQKTTETRKRYAKLLTPTCHIQISKFTPEDELLDHAEALIQILK